MTWRRVLIAIAVVAAAAAILMLPMSDPAPDGDTAGTDTLEDPVLPADPGDLADDDNPARDDAEDENGGSILNRVDQILRTLEEANIAFETPAEMRWGETRTMALLLSPTATAEELGGVLDHPEESDTARIRVARRMRASLTGTGFEVEPITPELQAVSYSEITEWRWEVEPTRTGRQQLHLALTALLDVDGEVTSRAIRTFSRDIEIEITPVQLVAAFMSENWQWLWAAILVPIVSWGWARFKARAKGSDNREPDAST